MEGDLHAAARIHLQLRDLRAVIGRAGSCGVDGVTHFDAQPYDVAFLRNDVEPCPLCSPVTQRGRRIVRGLRAPGVAVTVVAALGKPSGRRGSTRDLGERKEIRHRTNAGRVHVRPGYVKKSTLCRPRRAGL